LNKRTPVGGDKAVPERVVGVTREVGGEPQAKSAHHHMQRTPFRE